MTDASSDGHRRRYRALGSPKTPSQGGATLTAQRARLWHPRGVPQAACLSFPLPCPAVPHGRALTGLSLPGVPGRRGPGAALPAPLPPHRLGRARLPRGWERALSQRRRGGVRVGFGLSRCHPENYQGSPHPSTPPGREGVGGIFGALGRGVCLHVSPLSPQSRCWMTSCSPTRCSCPPSASCSSCTSNILGGTGVGEEGSGPGQQEGIGAQ